MIFHPWGGSHACRITVASPGGGSTGEEGQNVTHSVTRTCRLLEAQFFQAVAQGAEGNAQQFGGRGLVVTGLLQGL
jgi:hypothetical protein